AERKTTERSSRRQPEVIADSRADHTDEADERAVHGDVLRAGDAMHALAARVDDRPQNRNGEDGTDPTDSERDGEDLPHGRDETTDSGRSRNEVHREGEAPAEPHPLH